MRRGDKWIFCVVFLFGGWMIFSFLYAETKLDSFGDIQKADSLDTDSSWKHFDQKVKDYFKSMLPQDKFYLHTDKPYYSAGDSIRFAGFLLNAASLQDSSRTNYIYVELADRKDSVVVRQKIKRDSVGSFHGTMPLSSSLIPGEYYLRGYSRWMLNFDPSFIFSKNLHIDNAIERICSEITYEDNNDKSRYARVRFFSKDDGRPFSNIRVFCSFAAPGEWNLFRGEKLHTDSAGCIEVEIPEGLRTKKNGFLRVDFDDETYVYKHIFYLPAEDDRYAVSFFPEGGDLIAGVPSQVAFKAQASSGFSEEVRGYVVDAKGDSVAAFVTEHDGMGSFELLPQSGEQYRAYVVSAKGRQESFVLPAVKDTGAVLRVEQNHAQKRIYYSVQGQGVPLEYCLVGHIRGIPILLERITAENQVGFFSFFFLMPGIMHLLLTTLSGRVLSERLVFIDPPQTEWSFHTDKPTYGLRDKIEVDISSRDTLNGKYVISITDNSTINQTPETDNIVSSLLLTSDLVGYIDAPGYYFNTSGPERNRHLDLVMMTHGWRRHQITDFNRESNPPVNLYMEQGQYISGKVTNFWGKKSKKGLLRISALKGIWEPFKDIQTDEEGNFYCDMDYVDTVMFKIQGRSRGGYKTVNVKVDPDTFLYAFNPNPYRQGSLAQKQREEYQKTVKDRYDLVEGDAYINLKEVEIVANRLFRGKPLPIDRSDKYKVADETFILSKPYAKTAFDLVRCLPGIVFVKGEFLYSKSLSSGKGEKEERQPLFPIINDEVYYGDISALLKSIPRDNVDLIVVGELPEGVTNIAAMPEGDAIFVFLKKPQPIGYKASLESFFKLGFTVDSEFYHPVYDTPEQRASSRPDTRTTLYWNPAVRPDAEGHIRFFFYAADAKPDYTLTMEGVDTDGTVRRFTTKLPLTE